MGNLLSKVRRKYSQFSVSWGVQVGFTKGDTDLSFTRTSHVSSFLSWQFWFSEMIQLRFSLELCLFVKRPKDNLRCILFGRISLTSVFGFPVFLSSFYCFLYSCHIISQVPVTSFKLKNLQLNFVADVCDKLH